jgi:uncharacterized protein (TIRG00374 family)
VRHLLRRILLGIAVLLVVVFMVLSLTMELRKGSTIAVSLGQVSPWWFLLVALGSAGVVIMTTSTTAAPLPALSFAAAFICQHTSQAVGNLVPGPSAMAVRYALVRSYGVGAEDFARATITVSMLSSLMITAMPLLGIVLLTLSQQSDSAASSLLPLAIGATLLSVVSVGGAIAVLRSSDFTVWLAHRYGRVANRVRHRLHRHRRDVSLTERAALQGRTRLIAGLRASGTRVLAFVAGLYWVNGLLLVVCLWAAGVPTADLGLVGGLAVYTLGRLSTLVQVTPGGVGVVEVAYTAAYTAFLGPQYQSQVLSGVILYRLGTYLLPILIGAVTGAYWGLTRRRREGRPAVVQEGSQ